jgi:metal-dependent hydrolase (beta-lactamase superfamily II)
MRLRTFQADKGDCLLLTTERGKRVLIDGGMRDSYREHVAAFLGRLAREGHDLDLVYLSHIDQDHILGVLQLLDDTVAWRVRDYQHGSGNNDYPDPPRPRPPRIARLWHNPFHEQARRNGVAVADMLATTASVLEGGKLGSERKLAQSYRDLAMGVAEGIELSRRASPEQLGIPVNGEFGGKLIFVREHQRPVSLGTLRLTVIGPFEEDLAALQKEWNKWLREHEALLQRLRERMRVDAERLGTGEVERFQAAIALRAGELGQRAKVTVPNLASLMLLAEEAGKIVLLTGDGHADDILKGLERNGKLDGGLHVNVLKIQHHGSEHNLHAEFCRRVTADHYVICANGAYENPDLAVLDAIIDSRVGPDARRSRNAGAEGRFKFWFNCSSAATADADNKRHMREVERLIASRAQRSAGRIRYSFLEGHSVELRI